MYITCEGLRDASRDSWRTWLFRYFASRVHISAWTGGHRGDRVDTACYSLFRERDIKKNNDATCIEFAIKAAGSRGKRPSHPCTNLCESTS